MARPFYAPILIFLLWCVGLLAGGQFSKVAVPISEFSEVYNRSEAQIAWLLTLVSLMGAFFGLVAGLIAARMGMRTVLLISLVLGGGLSFLQSTLPSFSVLAFSRIIEGVSHLGLAVAAPTLIAQIANDHWRGAAMALWSTFFGVAFALTAWFGIPFVEHFGISSLFQTHGAFMLGFAFILALMLPTSQNVRPNTLGNPIKRLILDAQQAYQTPSVLWPGISWLFYTLTFLSLLTLLPQQMDLSQRSEAATVLSLVGIAISLTLVPIALRFLQATTLVIVGFALAGTSIVLTTGQNLPLISVAIFAALGVIQGGTFASVSQLNKSIQNRALGFGIMAQTGNLGNLLGTPVFLSILVASNLSTVLGVATALYLGAGLILLILFRIKVHKG